MNVKFGNYVCLSTLRKSVRSQLSGLEVEV